MSMHVAVVLRSMARPGHVVGGALLLLVLAACQGQEPSRSGAGEPGVSRQVAGLLTDGLTHHYKLDETAGTAASNAIGGTQNATLVNGPVWGAGHPGTDGGLVFDGVNDYLQMDQTNSLTSFSVSMWVYLDHLDGTTNDNHNLFFNLNGQGLYPRAKVRGNGILVLALRTGGVTQSYSTPTANPLTAQTWHHLVFTFRGGDNYSAIYKDGVLLDSYTFAAGTLDGGTGKARFGYDSNLALYLKGKLDEIRLYNRELSASEVTDLKNWTEGGGGDTTAPGAVTNLSTSGATASSLVVSWTAPGDDGSTGTATSYDLRYSTSTITTANWGSATQVTGEPAPAAAGTAQSMTVTGLAASTTYYFALKTSDEVPNTAALSNVPSGTTSAAGGSPNGLILKSPNGACWKLTMTDAGLVSIASVACP